jgi:hypothetical protein
MIIISTAAAQNAPSITPEQRLLVKEWLEFCRDKSICSRAMYVDYRRLRNVGRWGCEERVRKFLVCSPVTLDILASSKTLEGALKLAAKLAAARNPKEQTT